VFFLFNASISPVRVIHTVGMPRASRRPATGAGLGGIAREEGDPSWNLELTIGNTQRKRKKSLYALEKYIANAGLITS